MSLTVPGWPVPRIGIHLGLLVFLYMFLSLPANAAVAADLPEEPEVAGRSAIIIDQRTGAVLYEKDAATERPMASTTKIMTALLAIENGDLADIVTVSERAARIEGSRIYLEAGEQQSLENLLYALMLNSGNDAAIAIAEHIGGSEELFVRMMNMRAAKLGLRHTRFANPHGLTADRHYTTAGDLAKLARVAMTHPLFRRIVSTREYVIPWPVMNDVRQLANSNSLIHTEADVTGIKTGYTSAAGQCIVVSAKHDGREVIAVVLHSEYGQIYPDARKLLDYGLQMYEQRVLIPSQERVAMREVVQGHAEKVPVVTAGQITADMPAAIEDGEIERVLLWEKAPEAPIHRGYRLGTMQLRVNGGKIGEVPLIADADVERKLDWASMIAWDKNWWLLLVLLYIPWRVRLAFRRARRRKRIMQHGLINR